MAVGQGPLDLEAFARRYKHLAGQTRPHCLDRFGGQVGEVGQRLGLHLARLPIGAAQQDRLVDLVLVVPTGRYHVYRTTTLSHKGHSTGPPLPLQLL